jgi:hypothetical protein
MAAAHVQSKGIVFTSGNSNNIAFDSNVGSGALIVVAILHYAGGLISGITDTRSNTYAQIGSSVAYATDRSRVVDLWYAYNSSAGACTLTITAYDTMSDHPVYIHEYSGIITTDPYDKAASNDNVGTGANPITSNSTATTAQNDELIFGAYNANAVTTITADTGFTLRINTKGNCATEDKIVAATGAYAATFNRTASASGVARVVTFKAIAAAGNPWYAYAQQ